MITQITYERLFNLGSYESERISATCSVEDGDVEAAYDEARMAVSEQHMRTIASRETAPPTEPAPNGGATYAEAPASNSQRNYIVVLQGELDWNTEKTATYADQQGIDLARMTRSQASRLIDLLKAMANERAEQRRPAVKPGVVEEVDLPF